MPTEYGGYDKDGNLKWFPKPDLPEGFSSDPKVRKAEPKPEPVKEVKKAKK